ncbi:PIN domain-containing protein [Dyadobacter fermentans]|uniref:PilT protein domain protein n=1 Tax=Dyadobacter fermentans (strain ATCC 700827 / DSM 18053 / CIP 107007 / KCTC 52180 / NS114) TaxID=471854 RepID=C6VYG7_DYAFD|nr:PIN domain-containing protein [Dyadobacter fermentans]ACT91646.1 PilT protein domain protein [Dyadobacter fermentans DSM 18053]
MKLTNDNFFIDTNIALYLIDLNEIDKRRAAIALMRKVPFISPQVVFECINVCLRKHKMDRESVTLFVNWLTAASLIVPENAAVVHSALSLMDRYRLQPFDAKIVASALEAQCDILYSEDMQNGLVIDNRLEIVNPFI